MLTVQAHDCEPWRGVADFDPAGGELVCLRSGKRPVGVRHHNLSRLSGGSMAFNRLRL